MMRDLLHAAALVLYGSIAWVAVLTAVLALGLALVIAGASHAHRRYSR